MVGTKGWDGEPVFHGNRDSVWGDEIFLEMMVGMVTQQCECSLMPLSCALKKMAVMVNFTLCVFIFPELKNRANQNGEVFWPRFLGLPLQEASLISHSGK